MNTIKFEIIDPSADPSDEWETPEHPSPYFGLEVDEMNHSIRCLQQPDEIVINKPSIKVVFDYPLEKEHIIELVPCDGKNYFTRKTLGQTIAKKYQQIYEEEKGSTTLPVESICDRTTQGGVRGIPLINRAQTDGNWGIWGHDLSDLLLHTVKYHRQTDTYTLGIDS